MNNKNEWKECEASLPYFVRNKLLINTPNDGFIPFDLREYQKNALLRLQNRDYYAINKARQVGITNMLLALSLWECYFQSGIRILWITPNTSMRRLISRNFTNFHETSTFQSNIKIKTSSSKNKKEFTNGSIINFTLSSLAIEPAQRYDMLIIDEAAYISRAEDIIQEIPYMMSENPKVILASTATSKKNWFDKTFMRALRGQNKFIPMQLDWRVNDQWDEAWRAHQDHVLGPDGAKQELDGIVQERI